MEVILNFLSLTTLQNVRIQDTVVI